MTEPKPCPFCGNAAVKVAVVPITVGMEDSWIGAVYCKSCGAKGPRDGLLSSEERTREFIINLWNKGCK